MTFKVEGRPLAPPLYIDTANQNVGIGTATPQQDLHIMKSGAGGAGLRIERDGTSQYLDILSPAGSPAKVAFNANTVRDAMFIYTAASGNVEVGDVNIASCYFDSSLSTLSVGGTDVAVASARLEVTSTTKGFLPPRMSTTQKNAIASPATGLVVYDNVLNKLCVYTGSAWETVTSI